MAENNAANRMRDSHFRRERVQSGVSKEFLQEQRRKDIMHLSSPRLFITINN